MAEKALGLTVNLLVGDPELCTLVLSLLRPNWALEAKTETKPYRNETAHHTPPRDAVFLARGGPIRCAPAGDARALPWEI